MMKDHATHLLGKYAAENAMLKVEIEQLKERRDAYKERAEYAEAVLGWDHEDHKPVIGVDYGHGKDETVLMTAEIKDGTMNVLKMEALVDADELKAMQDFFKNAPKVRFNLDFKKELERDPYIDALIATTNDARLAEIKELKNNIIYLKQAVKRAYKFIAWTLNALHLPNQAVSEAAKYFSDYETVVYEDESKGD